MFAADVVLMPINYDNQPAQSNNAQVSGPDNNQPSEPNNAQPSQSNNALVLPNSNRHHTQPDNINHLLTCSPQQPNSNSLLLTFNQLLTPKLQQLNTSNQLSTCNHHQPNNMQPQANRNNLVSHNSNTSELANIQPCHLRQCESLP